MMSWVSALDVPARAYVEVDLPVARDVEQQPFDPVPAVFARHNPGGVRSSRALAR